MIYLDGSSTSLIAVYSGDERFDELWVGNDKIWPDVTGAAGFIISPPERGTLDYLYWLHAVDASDSKGNGYMWFEANGSKFYLNEGPNGSQVLTLRGDVISLTREQGEMLAGFLDEYVDIYAEIKQRKGLDMASNEQDVGRVGTFTLPPLPGTEVYIRIGKGRRKYGAPMNMLYKGMPSGSVVVQGSVDFGKGRGEREHTFPNTGMPDNGDTMAFMEYKAWGFCHPYEVCPLYPSFSKLFRLKIVNVS